MFRIRIVHVYLWWESGTDLLSPIRRILGSLQMSIFLTASRSTLQRGQRHLLLPVNLSSFRNNLRHSCKQMTQIMSCQWTILYIFVIEIFYFFYFFYYWGGGGLKIRLSVPNSFTLCYHYPSKSFYILVIEKNYLNIITFSFILWKQSR